jgi:hypothetical protein
LLFLGSGNCWFTIKPKSGWIFCFGSSILYIIVQHKQKRPNPSAGQKVPKFHLANVVNDDTLGLLVYSMVLKNT